MAETEGAPASPVKALRDAFGDPKPPDISRKITACVACRKQKIKCHMRDSQPPCTRCKKRGLSCTVNRSLQMLLESDTVWKHSMEKKIQRMEAVIGKIANHVSMSEVLEQLHSQDDPLSSDETMGRDNAQDSTNTDGNQPHNWEIVMDPDSGPAAIPGSCVSAPTQAATHEQLSNHENDMISRNIITLENAHKYFEKYQKRLDHFLYRILGDHSTGTLDGIRAASPLLTAAVCTVGALHLSSKDFEACYTEFLEQSRAILFSKRSTDEDVRALCVGAFWLSDLSWTLVGTAVRIATELQLHRSIFKALQGDRPHYLRTRLYYLVYVCDHHFSIPYGRPPMTRQCEAVRLVRDFLKCEHAKEDDARLVSQVEFWSIGSNVFDTFGVNVDRPLSDSEVPHLRRFSIDLDTLRAEWAEKFSRNAHVGNYPRKGVGLHFHFAKLYLCSHAFRGASTGRVNSRSHDSLMELEEIANSAVLSALSILRVVVSDSEVQSYLDGLPTYFDIMIAFAVVFLLKVSTKFSASVRLDSEEIKRLVTELVRVLERVTSSMHPRHLLVSIAKGIGSLLQRCCPTEDPTSPAVPMVATQPRPEQSLGDSDMLNGDFNWTAEETLDPFLLGEYDLLGPQDMQSSFAFNFPFDSMPQQH